MKRVSVVHRIKSVIRNLQTYLPGTRPLKFGLYNAATQYFGWHVEAEFKLLSRMPKPKLALDVGGNWGQSVLALKRIARPDRIVTFEPNPELAARMKRVFASDSAVQVEACGLGDVDDVLTLYVPRYRRFVYDGLASMDESEARDWLAERMTGFDPTKLFIDRHEIAVRTLDSYGFDPDIVKMDVQGLELQVLRGGLETFRKSIPVTIAEGPEPAVVELFKSIGMDAYRWDGERLIANDINSINILFIHPRRLAEMGFTAKS